MRNLELKAPFADLARGEEIARALGASCAGDLYQLDTYFHVASGRLKLRESGPAAGELIFYRRPEDSPTRWSDYFKASVASPEAIRDVLTRALGVRQQVEKTRRLFLFRGARIHLDRVTRLGTFIEFEVPTDDDADAARATMDELMRAFGLSDADAIAASYGEMMEGESPGGLPDNCP